MATALIQVDRAGGRYEARLILDWDGRSTSVPDACSPIDDIPAPPQGFPDWITFLLQTEGPSSALHALGCQLHDLLMSGDIGVKLRQARAAGPLRLLIKLEPSASKLNAMPWELMRNDRMLLFTNVSMPVARVAESFNPALELPKMCWPLRVMLVVASKDPQIHVEDEIRYIKDAFRRVCGLVDLEVCRLPDREAIRKLVEAMHPHVFHFIGHGGWDGELGGYLRLGQEDGASDIQWTAAAIRDDLAFAVRDDLDSPDQVFGAPRLAVLNACQSGQPDEHRGTLAAAAGLAELNVPAVIAMQGPVRGRAAARFAKGLYETLTTGGPLDRAVTRARVAITDEFPQNQRDYALPTLILGAPPERILDLSHCDPSRGLAGEPREKVLSFVDRVPRRRQLWDGLWTDQQADPRIFTITGPDRAGKGSLVRWCLGVASVLGYRTVLVELEDYVDSIGFLKELIEAAKGDAGLSDALADLELNLAKYEYEQLQANRGDLAYLRSPLHLYEELTSVLAALAAERPMLIGIDGLAFVEPGEWEHYALHGLVAPIALGQTGKIRLVVSLQERDRRFPPRHFKQAHIAEVPIKLFPPDDFVELATQKLRAMGYPYESFNAFVKDQQQDIKQDWGTEYFDIVDSKASAAKWEREW
ncbi:MAG TPA: CHAT domain-containing protein [Streptosporangiaceae bacterium]